MIKVVGYVQGYVYDANTNKVLDNVIIRWELPGGVADSTVATAVDGFNISNLPSGNYYLKCSKANYATSVIQVDIPKDDIAVSVKGGGSKEFVVDVAPKLYSLGANATGRVYKLDDPIVASVATPAVGAVVKLLYPFGNMVPNAYEAITDENGYYTFEDVPSAGGTIMIANYNSGDFSFFPYSNYYNFSGVSGTTFFY
ncbi:MAG: carboxypeptidase regulatory-like domain-containing protein [Chloroflexia bacterium]|nr:carboxypeptidase regulatory-like domain-containing protein [Chloroflexia bacterium]